MIMLGLAIFGCITYEKIGLDLYPRVDFPVVSVLTVLPGASPETIETTVSQPIEDALSSISAIKNLRSVSSDSASQVIIEFELEKNIDIAYQEVLAKLGTIRSDLPDDAEEPIVEKFDLDASPVMTIIVSGNQPYQHLSKISDKLIKGRLQQIDGVGQVQLVGQRKRKIWIHLDPLKLEGFGLTPQDVVAALQSHHIELPGGRVETGTSEYTATTKAEYTDPIDFEHLLISYQQEVPIYLADVGTVVDGMEEERSLARFNETQAIALLVKKQSGTNVSSVAKAVKHAIEALQEELRPQQITLAIGQDMSVYSERSVHDVQFHLIFGGLLAVGIVFIFLHNGRMTLISAMAIPLSVISTCIFMYALGFTMNVISMLALSLAIGLLIDDAIVVIENIYRHFKRGTSAREAASVGTDEIGLAAFAITMTIVAVFLPVAFMKGLIGRFFYQFGTTVSIAVLVSLFVAFTLTPMLASKFLRKETPPGRFFTMVAKALDALGRFYQKFLALALCYKKTTLCLATVTFFASLALVQYIPAEFFPMEDQSEFYVHVKCPLGSSLSTTDTVLSRVRSLIHKEPWVQYLMTTIGGDSFHKVNEGSIYVKMTEKNSRPISQSAAMEFIRQQSSTIPDCTIAIDPVARVSGGARDAPLQVDIAGPDLNKLEQISQALVAKLKEIPGFVDVDLSFERTKPELGIIVKRDRATALNCSPLSVAQTIKMMIGGIDVTTFKSEGELYDVAVRASEQFRSLPEDIYSLTVRNAAGDLISLGNLVDIAKTQEPVQIDRSNREKVITLYANLQQDKLALGDAVRITNSTLDELHLPSGYSAHFSGTAEMMQESFSNLLFALFLAVILVYMVLASQFESFTQPLIIMISLPFSVAGAFGALVLTQSSFNVMTMIGIIMLMGLVTKNAILLVDYTNTLRKRDHLATIDALLRAGPTRLYPILMTTCAMIFGMLPIALGHGPGSETRGPMATAIIGGLITSMLLTLIVVPAAYATFSSKKQQSDTNPKTGSDN